MKILKYAKSLMLIGLTAGILTTSAVCVEEVMAQSSQPVLSQENAQSLEVQPIMLVNNPKVYLNKRVLIKAKFDKFSTLGLDYKPAFKSSDDYISFLIKRDDTSFDIPLSELKLFLKRDVAEKFIDLKTNDVIEITGTVFSDALGDPWVDVSNLIVVQKAPEEK